MCNGFRGNQKQKRLIFEEDIFTEKKFSTYSTNFHNLFKFPSSEFSIVNQKNIYSL